MPVLINQKFPRCTLCGKMLPLRIEPIVMGDHRLCSKECVRLLHKLYPDQVSEQEIKEKFQANESA